MLKRKRPGPSDSLGFDSFSSHNWIKRRLALLHVLRTACIVGAAREETRWRGRKKG